MKKKIKIITLLLSVILLVSCSCSPRGDSRERNTDRSNEVVLTYKHKVGDIIYLKPDSLRAVIDGLTDTNEELLFKSNDKIYPMYSLYYFRKDGVKITEKFREELIY